MCSTFLKSDAKLLLFFELTKCFDVFFMANFLCVDN